MAMRKEERKLIVLAAIIFLLIGWSTKSMIPKNVSICENQRCASLTDSYAKEELLSKIFNLLKKNKNKDIRLFTAYPENRMQKAQGINFLLRRSLQETNDHWNAVLFTDVLSMDRKNLKFEFKIVPKSSALYDEGLGELSIRTDNGIILTFSNRFTIGSAIGAIHSRKTEWVIDYIDFDNKTLGGHYSSTAGPIYSGFDKGYQLLKFRDDGSDQDEITHITSKNTSPVTLLESQEKTGPPALTVSATINKASGNVILTGGDEAILKVEIENRGGSTAKDVQIIMSGHTQLVSYLGERKFVGDIMAGEKKVAECRGVLPMKIPQEKATFMIEIKEGEKLSSCGTKTFKVHFLAEGF